MHKGNISKLEPDLSMAKYFDGRVEIKKMVTDAVSKEVEAYLVTFSNGARTKLHYHETDQILIATEGRGAVALQGKVRMECDSAIVRLDDVHELNKGDFVCVPAYVWHWHGAAKGQDFVHIQAKKPGKTTWFE
jgi:quercetin dioxygenase-like cupin family protein